jgi:predicted Zn-dependent protease
MALRSAASLLFVGLALPACSDCCTIDTVGAASRTEGSQPAPAQAPTPTSATGAGTASAEPVSNVKLQMKLEAARGLAYDDGRAVIVADEARLLVASPDRAAADVAYAEGLAQREQNENLEAIRSHTKAVLLAPDVAGMYVGLGDALITQKGWESKAAAAFRSGLDLDPDSAVLWGRFADASWRIGDIEGSVAARQRMAELDSGAPEPFERMANVAFLKGEDTLAWQHVHAAEARGGKVPTQLRQMLSARSTEPAK